MTKFVWTEKPRQRAINYGYHASVGGDTLYGTNANGRGCWLAMLTDALAEFYIARGIVAKPTAKR